MFATSWVWCVLLHAWQANAQPSSSASPIDAVIYTTTSTKSCSSSPRTLYVYTSDDSTFVVSNLGSSTRQISDQSAQTPEASNGGGIPTTVQRSSSFTRFETDSHSSEATSSGELIDSGSSLSGCPAPSTITVVSNPPGPSSNTTDFSSAQDCSASSSMSPRTVTINTRASATAGQDPGSLFSTAGPSSFGATCSANATTTVTSYIIFTAEHYTALQSSAQTTQSVIESTNIAASGLESTNVPSYVATSCLRTVTSIQPGSTLISTAYQTAPNCSAVMTLPPVTSYVYYTASNDGLPNGNRSLVTLTTTMVESGSIASAGIPSCPSLASVSPITSYITASNSSCPSGWTDTVSASGALTTVYSCTLEESSYRGNGSQATRTVTSYVFDGYTASSSPVSIEECTNLTTFGTTTITAFQPGLNSTITVFQSGANASCAYPTANSSGLITGYEQQKTVTQTGPTVTIFYTISPSPSRAESTTFGLSQDTAASNSPSTSLAESTASSVSTPTQTPIVANATDLQQQSTSSDPFVTAQVVKSDDNPPIAPNTNDTFLLVTFGNNGTSASSAGSFRKRQSSDQSLVYNATQSFAAIAGGIYNLSATAASAPYGSSPPNCAITICGDSTCGPTSQLSTSFAVYSFTWTSSATQNSVATFSIQCAGQAYVALTNVIV